MPGDRSSLTLIGPRSHCSQRRNRSSVADVMTLSTPVIAVVDDEESVRKALGRLIRAAGFSVETYASGSDFLQSMTHRRPHCVVLDLRMPHVNGFHVQQALIDAGAQLPVVIITGDDSAES